MNKDLSAILVLFHLLSYFFLNSKENTHKPTPCTTYTFIPLLGRGLQFTVILCRFCPPFRPSIDWGVIINFPSNVESWIVKVTLRMSWRTKYLSTNVWYIFRETLLWSMVPKMRNSRVFKKNVTLVHGFYFYQIIIILNKSNVNISLICFHTSTGDWYAAHLLR